MIDLEERLKNAASNITPPETSGREILNKVKTTQAAAQLSGAKKKWNIPFLKSGVAKVTAAAITVSAALPLAVAITTVLTHNLDWVVSNLRGTYVDMEGVMAFGVWNAPETEEEKPTLKNLSYIVANAEEVPPEGNGEGNGEETDEDFDEELYDWESDYDWDPTKANVLVALDDEGNMKEVVYERTNGRGQVRQDTLGNAAMVYSSESFTYVMYVDDSEWEFWKDINFAQEAVSNSGFHCHHESMQTVVIHNKTGKVFPLNDLIKQVSDISGALNYTMQAHPTYDDYLRVDPMYGNYATQWYSVEYSEEEGVQYRYVTCGDELYDITVDMVKRDKFGQEYILSEIPLGAPFKTTGNSLVFNQADPVFAGSDGCMYMMKNGKLQVFGENFTLSPVDSTATASMKAMVESYFAWNNGEVYHLEDGYLYSMKGNVWKIAKDGTMVEQGMLEGSFPALGTDCYIIGGEIIALVDGHISPYDFGKYSCDGTLVRLTFGLKNGVPAVKTEKIMKASQIRVQNQRMIVSKDELPNLGRGPTKYFLLQVNDGEVSAECIAYGDHGGIQGVVNPIIEPLKLQ